MNLYRCRFCHKKIESENQPRECPKCGKGHTHRKYYIRFSTGKTKKKESFTKDFFNPVRFHLIGKLK